jgi:hypothetical protein
MCQVHRPKTNIRQKATGAALEKPAAKAKMLHASDAAGFMLGMAGKGLLLMAI